MAVDGRAVDIRVVTLPTVHGESVVMRILDRDNAIADLDRLGMPQDEQERFGRAIQRSYGAVLATGPTGSGTATAASPPPTTSRPTTRWAAGAARTRATRVGSGSTR